MILSISDGTIATLRDLSAGDREKLVRWAEEISGTSTASGARRQGSSGAGRSEARGRDRLRQTLRQDLQKITGAAAPPRSAPPHRPSPAPADPHIEQTGDGSITVTWRDPVNLAQDLQSHLSAGYLPLPSAPPPSFLLRLILPDGQILAVPSTADRRDGRCVARFHVGLPMKQKLRAVVRAMTRAHLTPL